MSTHLGKGNHLHAVERRVGLGRVGDVVADGSQIWDDLLGGVVADTVSDLPQAGVVIGEDPVGHGRVPEGDVGRRDTLGRINHVNIFNKGIASTV